MEAEPRERPVWRDPPKKKVIGPQSKWARRLRPLMNHPGRWAMIYSGRANTCYRSSYLLRSGGLVLPEGTTPSDWKFTSRTDDEGVGHVYARYLGKRRVDAR